MPTPLMKSFAEQAGKKPKTVEKLWKKCERLVRKKYEIDEENKRFYPLVVGCLKNLLGLNKEETEKDEMTTTNMGSYTFAPKVGDLQRREPLTSDPLKIETEIKDNEKYSKKIKRIKKALKESNSIDAFDDLISDNLEYYCEKYDEAEMVIDSAFDSVYKYLKIKESLLDELK